MQSRVGPPSSRKRPEQGQILVVFALAFVSIASMVGLVLDGSSTFAQRRNQQNAADLAALAGANDFLLNGDQTAAISRARAVAGQNGYTDGSAGASVAVMIDTSIGASVRVDISAPHKNGFASIAGMSIWQVGTTATALTGFPDSVSGAGPFIFSIDAFGSNGQPITTFGDPNNPYAFGDGNGDVPTNAGDIAWTNYASGNVDSNQVDQIIKGSLVINKTLEFGTYIGQHNNGFHDTLFSDTATYLSGQDVPVPIVDHAGNFLGWATFHVVTASGGASKTLTGYFDSKYVAQKLTVGGCANGGCPRYLGTYVLKLTN
jgi:Flp pilus assembly protein TadG